MTVAFVLIMKRILGTNLQKGVQPPGKAVFSKHINILPSRAHSQSAGHEGLCGGQHLCMGRWGRPLESITTSHARAKEGPVGVGKESQGPHMRERPSQPGTGREGADVAPEGTECWRVWARRVGPMLGFGGGLAVGGPGMEGRAGLCLSVVTSSRPGAEGPRPSVE